MQERIRFDAIGPHSLEKGFLHPGAAYVVVEYPHFDPFAGLGRERIAQAAARLVVAENVVLDMDVVARPGDCFEQRVHLRLSVDIGGQPASVERYGEGRLAEETRQREPLRRNARSACRVVLFQPGGDSFAGAARDDPALGKVLPEEEVDRQPGTRRQYQHQYPRQGLQRVAVVGDDDQHHADDRQRVDNQKDRAQNL